jgi:predicted metal-binding membrane protein
MAAVNLSVPAMGPSVPGGADTSAYPLSIQSRHWTPGYTLLMFSMWWLMMIAMMLPSAAPMVLLHAAITRKGTVHADQVETDAPLPRLLPASTAFIAGYLFMWGAFSLVAVLAQWALQRAGLLSDMMMPTSRLLASSLLLTAGLWQLTPLKTVCLRQCQSPIRFLSAHWRPGLGGAFSMGTWHGLFCLGCCWLLMALLFFGGVMNLIWIIALASFVLVEKLTPVGAAFGRVTGLLLITWGVWLGYTAF